MAVSREVRVIQMTANADSIDGKFTIEAIHATGAVADITDGDDNPIAAFSAEGNIVFPTKFHVNGFKRGAGAGVLYIYLDASC
jgi:hypothetical protein